MVPFSTIIKNTLVKKKRVDIVYNKMKGDKCERRYLPVVEHPFFNLHS